MKRSFLTSCVFKMRKRKLLDYGEKLPPSRRSSLEIKSDIKLSDCHILCFTSVCPLVALSKATFAENVHIVLSGLYYKAFIFHLLCV